MKKTKQTVLVVEDELVNRKILKKILRDSYVILEAENGLEAWQILSEKKEEIHAVLLDIVMPVMDGFGVLAKMRQAHMENMPVIVTTGVEDVDTEQKALEAGAWDYVSKPYNVKILMTRLRNAVARSQVAAFEKMQYLSEYDELTDIYNRRKMFSETRKMLQNHPEERFVFARIDLDHFTLFNTAFGEDEGNRLLRYLADILRSMAEPYPLCVYGRMNADVFCCCFAHAGETKVLKVLAAELQQRIEEYPQNYRFKVSVGICEIDDRTLGMDEYYFRASTAAQSCKHRFETHMAFYDETIGRRLAVELEIARDMQEALDNRQFEVYFQPKVYLSSERNSGAEALVRWRHPNKGMLLPEEFIPVFESNGFILKLDYYVWEETCRLLQKWLLTGRQMLPVSVNVSRVSLYNPRLVELLTGLINRYELTPALLQLEITESAYMTDPKLMGDTIESLSNAGFTVLMDDFGSEYSSMNTLKQTKVDVLKVDMKFLENQEDAERGEIILASVIRMANWLGMSVIVEGVETRQQRDFLLGAGCDCVQGFYYSKPMSREEYEKKYIYAPPEISESASKKGKDESAPHHNMTILVIDNNEYDREMLRDNLKKLYHIHECDSAEAGLAFLQNNVSKVRLILVDNILPGMGGMEFLRYCQQDEALSSIPKIMVAVSDSVEEQVRAFNEGAYDYITKPWTKELMMARIKHIMEISCRTSLFDVSEPGGKKSDWDPATRLLTKIAFRTESKRILETHPADLAALMVLDIDNFKLINDRYGHLTGDAVIRCVSRELKRVFRKTDVLGRFGGDEFVVMMTRIPEQETAKHKAAEIIRSVIGACAKDVHVDVSVSIGIAFSEREDHVDKLFARADQALYEAKNTGKARAVTYGETVPPITSDNKPIVLIHGDDAQLYPAIAQACGDSAAFVHTENYAMIVNAFEKYAGRICAVCLDMQDAALTEEDDCYRFVLEHGGERVAVFAAFREGDMERLREVMKLNVTDIITLPPQTTVIHRSLSRAIQRANADETVKQLETVTETD